MKMLPQSSEGIPTESQLMEAYFTQAGIPPITDWRFYKASAFFRLSAFFQYVKNKVLKENLKSEGVMFMSSRAVPFAKAGWAIASS